MALSRLGAMRLFEIRRHYCNKFHICKKFRNCRFVADGIAHGWLVIQASRSKYLDPHSLEDADIIDEADNLLSREFRD